MLFFFFIKDSQFFTFFYCLWIKHGIPIFIRFFFMLEMMSFSLFIFSTSPVTRFLYPFSPLL